ncbi:MAG: MBL fold metallo-hydrolase [Vicinamibacterales bacterium]
MKTFALAVLLLLAPDQFRDVQITTFIHSSIQLEYAGKVIQIDPWSLADLSRAKPADLILITDDPGHHLDVKAIAKLRKTGTPVVIPGVGQKQVPDGLVVANGETRTVAGVRIEAVGAYDLTPGEPYHPKGKANGYIVTLGVTRIYVVGVTECVPEVRGVTNIDVAFFPLNLPLQRMEWLSALDCIRAFKPKVVYPYHYDQDWVARVGRGEARPVPTVKGLWELKTALERDKIDVKFADWYPK